LKSKESFSLADDLRARNVPKVNYPSPKYSIKVRILIAKRNQLEPRILTP